MLTGDENLEIKFLTTDNKFDVIDRLLFLIKIIVDVHVV